MDKKAVSIEVSGRVQGVFYRASTCKVASHLGIKGWVYNESNGNVKIHAEGNQESIDSLIEWCKIGPPSAMVNEVKVNQVEVEGFDTFDIRRF